MPLDNETTQFIMAQNKGLQENMEKLFIAQTTAISARVDLKIDQKLGTLSSDVTAIIKHNEDQNGWIKSHTLQIESNADDISEIQCDVFEGKKVLCFMKKRWYIILGAFVMLNFLSAFLYHHMDFIKTFEKKTGIELVEKVP